MKERSGKTDSGRAWSGRTNGGDWGQKFLISLLGRMSVGASYVLLDIALPFYLPFNRKGFRATRDFFEKRLGCGRSLSWRRAYATHRLFGQMMFDRFRFFTKGMSGLQVEVEGRDELRARIGQGSGCIAAGAHVGSMEMTGYMLGDVEIPVNALIFGGENRNLQNRRTETMKEHGVRMIPVKDDLSHIFAVKSALDAGEIVSMPCDRLFGSGKCFEMEFLGAPARFPVGAFILAAQTGCDLVTMFTMKEDSRSYRVLMKTLEVDREGKNSRTVARELAGEFVKELENIVKRYPLQWFNFYDFWALDEDAC